MNGELSLSQADITYFSTMAGIAATLLGLSFLALTFFLTSVFSRYDRLALPIFLEESRSRGGRRHSDDPARGDYGILVRFSPGRQKADEADVQRSPIDITDWQLFDGDPLVVFVAFSTGVSWNLYFLALTLGITATSGGFTAAWLVAGELLFFYVFFVLSLILRHQKYMVLRTYRTGDERLWTPGEWLAGILFGGATLFACWVAVTQLCGGSRQGICALALSSAANSTAEGAFLVVLKVLSVLALALGLYVTNKDFFVFFKAKMSDEMRERWLRDFVGAYPQLMQRVNAALETTPADGTGDPLRRLWHDGCPPPSYIREKFSPNAGDSNERWRRLLEGASTVAAWMFDVPGIAAWAYDLDYCLATMPRASQPDAD